MTLCIFALEIILIYIASAIITKPAAADLTAATVAWSLFTLFLNMSIGNIRSIVSPKVLETARVRSQNVSGLSSLISLVVVVAAVALGALMAWVCSFLHAGYWMAAAVFSLLAALVFVVYMLVLNKVDGIAGDHIEELTRALAKV
jgi:ABC-2 type transport system permease protein